MLVLVSCLRSHVGLALLADLHSERFRNPETGEEREGPGSRGRNRRSVAGQRRQWLGLRARPPESVYASDRRAELGPTTILQFSLFSFEATT